MSEINELRERVEAAEERFGLIDEQQRHYSDRVIGLIETIEAQLAAARSEIEQQIDENLRLNQENEELRSMLHTVLRSIEKKTFTQTLQNLEVKVSALVSNAQAATPGAAEDATPAPVEAAPAMEAATEAEPEPEIDALVDPADDAAAEAEADVILEAAPEEAADEFTEESPEDPAAALPAASAEQLMAQAKQAAATGADPAEPAQETAEAPAEMVMESPDEATGFEPAPAEDSPAAEELEAAPEHSLPEENPEASAEEAPEAAFEITPAEAELPGGEMAGGEMAGEEMAGEEMAGENDGMTAPEEAMSDVTFEDDPAAIAETDTDEIVAEQDFAAEASEPQPEPQPEMVDLDEAAPEAMVAPAVEAAFDQLAETAAAASKADAGGSESTPTVKEIIRRVGDLARELEKAEAQRKAQAAADAPAPESGAAETAPPQPPAFDQAANA